MKEGHAPKTNEQYYFFRQQDILIGLEYFFYPQNHKEKILKVFRESYPDAYAWGAPQSIVKAVVFAVIAVFRKNGFCTIKVRLQTRFMQS